MMIEAKIDPDKKLMFLVVIVLIIVGIGYTYSYFNSKDDSEVNDVDAGKILVNYVESTDGIIRASDIVPILDKDMENKATKLSFDVTNEGTVDAKYNIKLIDLTIDSELSNANFKWSLFLENEELKNGTFESAISGSDYTLIENQVVETKKSNSYILYIWISETNEEQDAMKEKTFQAKILIDALKA